MGLFNAIGVASSSMVANRIWLDIIANNIANSNTTRTESGEPYRRRIPIFAEILNEMDPTLTEASDDGSGKLELVCPGNGVRAVTIATDNSAFRLVYNPGHPDADKNTGFVRMPNVSTINEMVDMISANRAYDASVQVVNTAKAMVNKALEIGK